MKKLLAFTFVMASVAGSCLAAPITWSNSFFPAAVGPTGTAVPGNTNVKTFTANNGINTLVASSLVFSNLPNSIAVGGTFTGTPTLGAFLGWKNEGAAAMPPLEHGLGIYDTQGGFTDAEIRGMNGLQINLTGINFVNVAFTIDSLDPNEGFRVFGSNQQGGTYTLLGTGIGTNSSNFVQTQTYTTSFKFFTITSNTPGSAVSSVLLRSVTANDSAVPEPATMGMIGLGFLALGAARLRKKAAR